MASISELFRNHNLYPEFIQVKSRLQRHQFVCWLAGGAVRDLYLDRPCADFDLVTDASTENLKQIFPEALLVGEKFGVLKIVLKGGFYFDLTTFRQESDYLDGRRPSSISASTPLKDALRRDFTVNALFWDDENQVLIDYVGGVQDINLKRLVAVGSPVVRFGEDYLRIIRLLRFSAQLSFSIEEETLRAAKILMGSIDKVSGERIWSELKKITSADQWNFVKEQTLFKLFWKQIFQTELPEIAKLNSNEENSLHLYFLLSYKIDNFLVRKKILSGKLRLSNVELLKFEYLHRAQAELIILPIEKISLELEDEPLLRSCFCYLVSQGLFEDVKFQKCLDILSQYPRSLIGGENLKDLIPPQLIGVALRDARLKQFEGVIKTRQEALDYIKIHFARSP